MATTAAIEALLAGPGQAVGVAGLQFCGLPSLACPVADGGPYECDVGP